MWSERNTAEMSKIGALNYFELRDKFEYSELPINITVTNVDLTQRLRDFIKFLKADKDI